MWVTVHIGTAGNEIADRLAKTAANDNNSEIIFKRLPIGQLIDKIKEETLQKWQKEWEGCTKAELTKKFFPKVQDSQRLRIEIIPIFTAMVTGHGKPELTSTASKYWKTQTAFAETKTKLSTIYSTDVQY